MEQELRGSTRLGNYLRRLRVGYGLSLRRVEDKAKTGGGEIDNSQLSRYERGKCYPSFDKLCLLANIFNVPIQNFSDVLDLERVEAYEPAEPATYEDIKAEAGREWDQGNYARAYAIYETALARLEDGAEGSVDPETLARARFNLARTLLRMGKISLAETELRLILRRHRDISPTTEVAVLGALADAHEDKGDRYLALLESEKALALAREAANVEYEGYALHRIGRLHFLDGEHAQALDSFRGARTLLEDKASRYDLTLIRINIGFCQAMLGKVDRGVRELREALQVSGKEGYRRCSTYALLYLGQIHLAKQELAKARDFFEEAELMAHGGEERFVDILFQTAYHLWEMARLSGNQVQEKVYFGRLKFLRSQLDRHFLEVEKFDQFIEQGKSR
ncbi:MAG: helix-turn-helix domain-containing protein [Acidobacteria bacterium]|nr:helix-turn-helix domain-containing protein [Acidobacteriota bacterium]